MLPTQKLILFNTICTPIRIVIILLYYFLPSPEISIVAFIIGSGFLLQWIRKNSTGAFGSIVYWPRLFHFVTYYTAAFLMIFERTNTFAFIPLIIDIIIGYIVVSNHYASLFISKPDNNPTIETLL